MSDSTLLKEDQDIEVNEQETPTALNIVDDEQTIPGVVVKSADGPKPATIHVNFSSNSDKIQIKSKATGEKSLVVAANKRIHLIHGRLYFIPVDSEVNSDEYGNMKQFSQTTDKYDVKYIKDGKACIDPILHNAIIDDAQQLCVLW